MARPDDSDDADGFVPPLPPEDRIWRHPSELGRSASGEPPRPAVEVIAAPSGAGVGDAARGRTVVLAMAAGAVATLALLALIGTFDQTRSPVVVEQVAVALPNGGGADPVDVLGTALARVDARAGSTTTTASGVVYRSDGHVLTAAAVVADADDVVVTLADGRVLDAGVVGVDEVSGVAVVKVDADELSAAVLADVDGVDPGDPALSVSHPPDPAGSPAVSTGTINGMGWRVDAPQGTWHDLIGASFDAAPTTPGAVVCTEAGAVLGLVLVALPGEGTGIAPVSTAAPVPTTTNDASEGPMVHYATPIDAAIVAADELIATGRTTRAWLGVMGDDLDTDLAGELGRAGAVLTEVTPDSPADTAGLRPGDIVVHLDGAEVLSVSSLVVAIRAHEPGDEVTVTVIRDGDTVDLPVTLGAQS
ncbi:S1C family serine protease [Rhabdothermincola salaria]|uniref:S1C family serine protease n=1 Tax=Rhabdothermincola salaria TaxID=2903142 RepID=UPI001E6163FD|nr:trypsin-like peptidase domain-containing protein [Rhabdothermincola salaria]MCD9625600.1 S1C family serine protease [Rhabdothermincola salaria]